MYFSLQGCRPQPETRHHCDEDAQLQAEQQEAADPRNRLQVGAPEPVCAEDNGTAETC